MRFNQSKPVDYNAHSVSMSDVVAIPQGKDGNYEKFKKVF